MDGKIIDINPSIIDSWPHADRWVDEYKLWFGWMSCGIIGKEKIWTNHRGNHYLNRQSGGKKTLKKLNSPLILASLI